MHELIGWNVQCPACGEIFEILVDGSVPHQRYIEDCEVCCRPIDFDVRVGADGTVSVTAAHEND